MGRPPKEGIDYAEWDANLFEDPKIGKLITAQGIAAFTVYFYLCLRAFNENGYFLCWGDDLCATTAKVLGKGASAQYVRSCVEKCFQVELFDKELFELHHILTSRGIQKRYWRVKRKRSCAEAPKDFWLLDENGENQGRFVSCAQKEVSPPRNRGFDPSKPSYDLPKPGFHPPETGFHPPETGFSPPQNHIGEKEKEKEKKKKQKEKNKEKENYSLSLARPRGKHQNVMLTDGEYADIKAKIPDADAYIDGFSAKLHDKGYTYTDHHATILAWWETDKSRRRPPVKTPDRKNSSFDVSEFFARATKKG